MADLFDSNADIAIILARTGLKEEDTEIVEAAYRAAYDRVLARCYPFDENRTEVPARYESTVIEIAVYLLNKQGAEGETVHNENGINRTYESAYVPESMLAVVTPRGKVFGL